MNRPDGGPTKLGRLFYRMASRLKPPRQPPEVERIDALLPQTQCGQCGYPGCRPYAQAIADGQADIDQCPPGGAVGVRGLAKLLGRRPKPLNPAYGIEQPKRLAHIDEDVCIGCTLCMQACPVDAILGAAKQMHTVIESECTGCELCVAPCPVDCIEMVAAPDTAAWPLRLAPAALRPGARRQARRAADTARERYRFRQQRLTREQAETALKRRQKKEALGSLAKPTDTMKKAAIAAALARAQQKKSGKA